MIKRLIIAVVFLIGLVFVTNGFLPLQESYGYNKPWDQGHDSTDPEDPDDPEKPCEPPCDECDSTGSPVFLKDGNHVYKETDILIPGRIPLEITRTYNSMDDKRTGLFGYGWTFNYGLRLLNVKGDGEDYVVILMPNGQRYKFIDNEDGTYTPPTGIFQLLVKNIDDTYDLSEKDGTTYGFDADGNMITVTDTNGNQITVSYDQGCPSGASDNTGRTLAFTKGANGKIASIRDFAGRIVSYTYDVNGNLATITNPLGNITTYSYDSNHNLVSIVDARGNTVETITYNSDGTVATHTSDEGSYTYNYVSSTQTKKTDNNTGGIWTYTFDSYGVITAILDPLGNTTSKTYDSDANLISETIAGNTTTYTYDANGNLLTETDALGNTTTYTYDLTFNKVSTITDVLGRTTTFGYDANGNLTGTTDALGNETDFSYDTNGDLLNTTDALGNVINFSSDSYGYITQFTDALGNNTTFTYDGRGNLLNTTDANGNSTSNTYDILDRLAGTTDSLGNTTSYTFDSVDNLVSMTDANGNITSNTYDAYNRLTQVANTLGNLTNNAYDANSNLIDITDANGNITTNTYDAINRLTKTTYPDGTFETFSYNADGNLIARTDRNGNNINYTYDAMHRLTVKTYPDGTTTDFSYDSNGNILTTGNSDVSFSFSYDALSRVTQVTNSTIGKSVSYSYLCCGLKSSMANPEGGVTNYDYDALKRLTSLTNSQGETTSYTYDNLSRIIRKDMAIGTNSTYTYDALGRTLSLANKTSSNSVISNYSYTYDNTLNRTSMTTLTGTHNYAYDKIYQLTQAAHPTTATENYNYDPVHNRLSSTDYGNWSYNNTNELLSYDGTTFTYDANGNTISKADASGTTNYQYDYENRLERIDNPDGTYSEYRYDPFGKKIKKDVNGTVTWFVYDISNDLSDVIAEYDASGLLLLTSYSHGLGIDEIISMRSGGNSYFYQKDALGSITSLTDNSESVVNAYEYDAFGNIINKTEAVNNPYGYTGRRLDNESGLMYYRARYYDSVVGRFLTNDPIGFSGGINFYSYVQNNPVNFTDPEGLYGTTDCSYYDRQCSITGSDYYCNWAPKWCKRFNRLDKLQWTRCVRQCLQDYDKKYCSPRGLVCKQVNKKEEKNIKNCNWKGHFFCYWACARNSNKDPLSNN